MNDRDPCPDTGEVCAQGCAAICAKTGEGIGQHVRTFADVRERDWCRIGGAQLAKFEPWTAREERYNARRLTLTGAVAVWVSPSCPLDPPADPAVTTYGELEPGQWYAWHEAMNRSDVPITKAHVGDQEGYLDGDGDLCRDQCDSDPVRRLTPAEVARHFADLAGGSFVEHEEPAETVRRRDAKPDARPTDDPAPHPRCEAKHVRYVDLDVPTEDRSKPAPGYDVGWSMLTHQWQLARVTSEAATVVASSEREEPLVQGSWKRHDAQKGGAA